MAGKNHVETRYLLRDQERRILVGQSARLGLFGAVTGLEAGVEQTDQHIHLRA